MEWKLYERGDGHGREWKSKMPWMPTRTSLDGMDSLLFLSVPLCSSPLFALSLPLFFCLTHSLPSSPLCETASRLLRIQAKLGYERGMIRGSFYRVSIFGTLHLYD